MNFFGLPKSILAGFRRKEAKKKKEGPECSICGGAGLVMGTETPDSYGEDCPNYCPIDIEEIKRRRAS